MDLNLNCKAEYFSAYPSQKASRDLFNYLLTCKDLINPSKTYTLDQMRTEAFGKRLIVTEKIVSKNLLPEKQHGKFRIWTTQMLGLKERIEYQFHRTFDVCVYIYYPDGNSGVAFHSDCVSFGDTGFIPSISLGATKLFQFRGKSTGVIHDLYLHSGDMTVIGKYYQERYEYALPFDSTSQDPRINLTFRPPMDLLHIKYL